MHRSAFFLFITSFLDGLNLERELYDSMEKMPHNLLKKFMNGEHIIRIKEGLFNGIWSDMAIESTYMKVGKGKMIILYSFELKSHVQFKIRPYRISLK